MADAPDILGSDTRPAFFPLGNADEIGLVPPTDRLGIPIRTWVRALAGMQKEALVVNGASGSAWRLTSDEGPYLAGHDRAPCPLCTFAAGMVAAYMNAITAAAASSGLDVANLELTLTNHYTMEGSALQGTMVGGALPPELAVEVAADADVGDLRELVERAVVASPVNGLLRGIQSSLFKLNWNSDEVPVGSVGALEGDLGPDPGSAFDLAERADLPIAEDLMVKVTPADQIEGVPGGVNSSLQESQSRRLRVQARCSEREDGLKVIHENLFQPIGSEFRFLSDEAPEFGGAGRAPDALAYLAAGIGFCFMTQFGRYAKITKKRLESYYIVQDTHFSNVSIERPGKADPIETHVYLVTPDGEDFARKTLEMGEQTCFLHATCRTDLDVKTKVSQFSA